MEVKEFYAQSLGISEPWKVSEVDFAPEENRVTVRVECDPKTTWVDPDSTEAAALHGWKERTWRHLDTCECQTWIVANVPRILRKDGKTEYVKVPWAEPHGRFTIAKESLLIDILRESKTVSSVARLLGLTRSQLEGVMSRAVRRGLDRRKLEPLILIGIDEKALRKRHNYATIITDLCTGNVIEIGDGRTKEVASDLLESLPEEVMQSIEAVTIDMWPAYISAIEETLPESEIVFDRFHIKGHLNQAVDQVRRQENKQLMADEIETLKGTKWHWLKRHDDLRKKSAKVLRELLAKNLNTGVAWSLKETFDHFWSYKSVSRAMSFLFGWVDIVKETKLTPMIRVAEMVEKHMSGILNYIHFPITNAASESVNSRIQDAKVRARGLPNFDRFRERVLFFFGGLSLYPAWR